MTAKYVTCRILNRHGNRCTGEAVVPDAELLICARHLAAAMRLIADAREAAGTAPAAAER